MLIRPGMVVAWLMVQAGSVLFPTFDAPQWVMKILVVLLVLGFAPTVIAAWAFEITPEGIKRESEVDPEQSIAHHTGRKIVALTVIVAVIAAALLSFQIIRRPIITEKGLGVKEIYGTVVFEVSAKATKTQIKEAVQQIFKVKVSGVRTANFPGKMRRRGQTEGYRRDWKKAYVKLADGEKMIEFAENL